MLMVYMYIESTVLCFLAPTIPKGLLLGIGLDMSGKVGRLNRNWK